MEDAVRGGCNLFDLDQLRLEYSPDEYQNLLMCEFIDDLASVFPLADLQACMVDSWEVWEDFQALALRPFGWREVWIGYDPAKGTQNGDSAGCVVIAPPTVPGGKFRILERHQWRGMDFRAQAEAIRKLTQQYNVTYIGIDSTGVGHGVYENVKAFSLLCGSLSITPTSKTPRCSRHTTLSATAVWSLTPGIPTLRSHLWLSAAPSPPAETALPTKPAAAKKPATQIWHGQRCTHCLTNRCRAKPPIPATLWRFLMTENTAQDVMPPDVQPNDAATTQAFSFGDPIPVLDRRELLDYVECVQMDRWYEPPVSFDGLARTYRAAVHHSSPIAVKRDILSSTYIPTACSASRLLPVSSRLSAFGNAYLEKRTNRLGASCHWSHHWRSTPGAGLTLILTGSCSTA